MKLPWLTNVRVLIASLSLITLVLIGCQSLLAQAFHNTFSQDCEKLFNAIALPDSQMNASSETELAKKLTEEALSSKKEYGSKDSRYAAVLANKGKVLARSGDYKSAESAYREALQIDEKALGETNPALISDLSGLCHALAYEKKFQEAEPLLNRLIEISKKEFGPQSPRLTRDLTLLATVYLQQKKFDQAEATFKSLVAINNQAYGPDALVTAICLNNLGTAYSDQGKEALAFDAFSKAFAIVSKKEHATQPESWRVKSNYYDFNKAIDSKYVVAENRSTTPFPEDVFSKATLLQKERKFAEAEKLLKANITAAVNAPSPVDAAKLFVRLNNILFDRVDDTEAILYGTIASRILDRLERTDEIALWQVNVHSYLALSFERQAGIAGAIGKDSLLKNAQNNFEQALQFSNNCKDGVSDRWTSLIKTRLASCKKQKQVTSFKQATVTSAGTGSAHL